MLQLLSRIYSCPTLEHLLNGLAREESGHKEDELRVGLAQVEGHEDILSGSGQVLDTATATSHFTTHVTTCSTSIPDTSIINFCIYLFNIYYY